MTQIAKMVMGQIVRAWAVISMMVGRRWVTSLRPCSLHAALSTSHQQEHCRADQQHIRIALQWVTERNSKAVEHWAEYQSTSTSSTGTVELHYRAEHCKAEYQTTSSSKVEQQKQKQCSENHRMWNSQKKPSEIVWNQILNRIHILVLPQRG